MATSARATVCIVWGAYEASLINNSEVSHLRVTIAVVKHSDQSNLGRKGWFTLPHRYSLWNVRWELKQSRNLEAGADTEAMEGYCLLTYSPWLSQPDFL